MKWVDTTCPTEFYMAPEGFAAILHNFCNTGLLEGLAFPIPSSPGCELMLKQDPPPVWLTMGTAEVQAAQELLRMELSL